MLNAPLGHLVRFLPTNGAYTPLRQRFRRPNLKKALPRLQNAGWGLGGSPPGRGKPLPGRERRVGSRLSALPGRPGRLRSNPRDSPGRERTGRTPPKGLPTMETPVPSRPEPLQNGERAVGSLPSPLQGRPGTGRSNPWSALPRRPGRGGTKRRSWISGRRDAGELTPPGVGDGCGRRGAPPRYPGHAEPLATSRSTAISRPLCVSRALAAYWAPQNHPPPPCRWHRGVRGRKMRA
jgi:hypothetical protein